MVSAIAPYRSIERNGFRDEWISRIHRTWGVVCTAVDIDFLLVEFDLSGPRGIIEYKYFKALEPVLTHPTYRAIRLLCDCYSEGALPFFIVRYWHNAVFHVTPVNVAAKKICSKPVVLSEREYVRLLYALRDTPLSESIAAQFSVVTEPDEA